MTGTWIPGDGAFAAATVAGIDVSTFALDVVWLPTAEQEPVLYWHERLPLRSRQDADEAAFAAARRVGLLIGLLPWGNVQRAYVEAPVPVRRFDTTVIKIARIQGAVVSSLPPRVHVEQIHPGGWKKVFTGNGNAKKERVEERCRELGLELPSQDAGDALGIAWAAREKMRADPWRQMA